MGSSVYRGGDSQLRLHWLGSFTGVYEVSIFGFIFSGWSESLEKALLISCQKDKHPAADVLRTEWRERLQCSKFRIFKSSVLSLEQPTLSNVCVLSSPEALFYPLQIVNLQSPAWVEEGLRVSNCFGKSFNHFYCFKLHFQRYLELAISKTWRV